MPKSSQARPSKRAPGKTDVSRPSLPSAITPVYTVIDLGVLSFGVANYPRGINAKGNVTGFSDVPIASWLVGSHAFLHDGAMRDLGTLHGGGPSFWPTSVGFGINDHLHVVGYSDTIVDNKQTQHAFLFDGQLHDLETLPGGTWSRADGINAHGHVVGSSNSSKANEMHMILSMARSYMTWELSLAGEAAKAGASTMMGS